MTPELVIFDLDGTLIDSELLSCQAIAEALQALGFDYSTEDILTQFVGTSNADMRATIERDHGRSLPNDLSDRAEARMATLYEAELQAIPGTVDLLQGLSAPCCVASNSPSDYVRRYVDLVGLGPYLPFEARYSADMVEQPKPAPDVYLHAAAEFGVAPGACLVVEDSSTGVRAARAAGMTVLGFLGGSHVTDPVALAGRLTTAGALETFAAYSEAPALLTRA